MVFPAIFDRHVTYKFSKSMKKGIVGISVIIIVVVAASLYPVTKNSTININATFDNTFNQVLHINNWKNWYPEIRKSFQKDSGAYHFSEDNSKKIYRISIPGNTFTIHALSPMTYNVTDSGHSYKNFAFTVFPGENSGKMKIYLTQKVPLITTLFSSEDSLTNPLNGLKSFLETPKELYGYNIEMSQIRDPVIASLPLKTISKNIFQEMENARNKLMHYVEKNKLKKTGVVSVSYIPLMHDSIQITVGIPVDKSAPPDENIKCLQLPAKGRVLTADYSGIFSNRFHIYQAMSKYLTDHTLSIPAESFERYLNDSLPTSDSSQIKMELNYPVY